MEKASKTAQQRIVYKGLEYTGLERLVNTPQPFVAAYKYEEDTGEWAHGNYFTNEDTMVKWIKEQDKKARKAMACAQFDEKWRK